MEKLINLGMCSTGYAKRAFASVTLRLIGISVLMRYHQLRIGVLVVGIE